MHGSRPLFVQLVARYSCRLVLRYAAAAVRPSTTGMPCGLLDCLTLHVAFTWMHVCSSKACRAQAWGNSSKEGGHRHLCLPGHAYRHLLALTSRPPTTVPRVVEIPFVPPTIPPFCLTLAELEQFVKPASGHWGSPRGPQNRSQRPLNALQQRIVGKLKELRGSQDWAAMQNLESEAQGVAAALHSSRQHFVAADIYTTLGSCFESVGQHERAMRFFEHALVESVEANDRSRLGRICRNLQDTYIRLRQHEKAIILAKKDVAICTEILDQAGLSRAFSLLATCYYALQDQQADRMCLRSLEIAEQVGSRTGRGILLGRILISLGYFANGIAYLEKQFETAEKHGFVFGKAGASLVLGEALWSEAQMNHLGITNSFDAQDSDSGSMRDRIQNLRSTRMELANKARANSTCIERMHDAVTWLKSALALAQEHGIPNFQVDALLHLSKVSFFLGERNQGLVWLKQLLQVLVDLGDKKWCSGCCQWRDEDANMVTCHGCGVARSLTLALSLDHALPLTRFLPDNTSDFRHHLLFSSLSSPIVLNLWLCFEYADVCAPAPLSVFRSFCNAEHAQMASLRGMHEEATCHREICPLLQKWRQVHKGCLAEESFSLVSCCPQTPSPLLILYWHLHLHHDMLSICLLPDRSDC